MVALACRRSGRAIEARLLRAVATVMCGLAIVCAVLLSSADGVQAQDEAQAASGPPLYMALFVDSDTDRCYDRGATAAVRRLAALEQEKINARGGINGRRVELKVLDGRRDDARTIANVREALSIPDLLAMIGLSATNRGEKVFAALGDQIGKRGVPFITSLTVSDLFASYPNVFSTRPSQEAERVPVMAAFASELGFRSVGFLARSGSTVIDAIGDGLAKSAIGDRMVADHRLERTGEGAAAKLDDAAVDAAVADLKAKGVGLVVLAVGTSLSESVVTRMLDAGYTPAILVVGDLDRINGELAGRYPNAMYQLDWESIPEVEPDAVRNVVTRSNPQDWIFDGAKIASAPGWKDGTCDREYVPEPFSETNLRAIAAGAQFADMVSLTAEAAATTARGAKVADMHKAVLDALGRRFAVGRGAYKGRFENWSFFPDTRVRAKTPFVIILPQGLGRTQLAPVQFLRTRTGALARMDTVYLDVDMLRVYAIDNDEKSFYADFYLAMRTSDRIGISDIAFTNAFIDPRTNGPHLAIQTVHPGGVSEAYPASMQIYRVSGRFRFTPDFSEYPFDSQQYSIDIQPRSGDKAFIIQPPPLKLRDMALAVDNWDVVNQYVASVSDFVPVVNAFTHEPSVVPFYQTRYVWQMKREATDYYLRVVIPLAVILIVAYLSIFIPQTHLEAIITLQVTALLSAVALYLSLPQIDSDTATVSDRIFVLDYLMVSLMILISILRINVRMEKWHGLNRALVYVHVLLIPALVIGSVGTVLRALPFQN